MKKIKITKSLLKKTPDDLLVALGLVDVKMSRLHPERLYMSADDAKVLKSNYVKFIKKHNKTITKTFLKQVVEFHWLNYGPNENLGDIIKPGFGLILE